MLRVTSLPWLWVETTVSIVFQRVQKCKAWLFETRPLFSAELEQCLESQDRFDKACFHSTTDPSELLQGFYALRITCFCAASAI